jgi:hypothetical protein
VGLANGSVIFGGGEAPEGLTVVLANLPWSEWAIVFIGGILIGVWTDWWFRTFDDKRRNAGKGLGAQLTRLGDELARLQFATARASDWPKNLGTARLGVMRALIRMGKFGIWNPGAAAFGSRVAASFWWISFERSGLCCRASALGSRTGARRPVEVRPHRPRL